MDKFRQQPQHYRMNTQAPKVNKQPMKVVYIGNPMMFKANNCLEFRQIVQELTGQASEEKHTENSGYMNNTPRQPTARINVMDRMVDENLLRPSFPTPSSSTDNVYKEPTTYYSSASEYVNDELWYHSSATERPSSTSVEYVKEEKLHPSSSPEFVDDFFSVEVLNRLDEFHYPSPDK